MNLHSRYTTITASPSPSALVCLRVENRQVQLTCCYRTRIAQFSCQQTINRSAFSATSFATDGLWTFRRELNRQRNEMTEDRRDLASSCHERGWRPTDGDLRATPEGRPRRPGQSRSDTSDRRGRQLSVDDILKSWGRKGAGNLAADQHQKSVTNWQEAERS